MYILPHVLLIAIREGRGSTANLRTKIRDFRGFDSSRILIFRGGIIMSIGNKLESSNLSRDNLSREIWSRCKGSAVAVLPPSPSWYISARLC